jgi:type I restriction enzyme S subunit
MEGLNSSIVKNLIILLPPLSEQEQIVSYLDEKTSLIDEMIEKKKRKIELLKEYRTSLINTVVTKGLNPDVPMKDSGIEWIGEIPRHWELKSIKYISDIVLGKMLTNDNKGDMVLKPYLRSFNIQNNRLDMSDVNEMWFSNDELKKLRLQKGDLLLNEGGDVGRTVMWKDELDECYIQNSVNRVRVIHSNPHYIKYVSILYHGVGYYDSIVSRVSIPHLTKDKLENVSFILPPLSEQEQIVSYLDEKTSEIDKTIELENKKIELLKEYRQSLISNVVTGKIKVVSE